ncbi:VWA-like domain-containing protein [Azospirillum brasilense]|uniref:VWA-like domain-containing protein n=1 Tax=Azospirillum brasilense TaxID=192 RepID=UPI001EDC4213|nr:VWA-like domain-containing protein [Azospirillum brasilense]UKJ75418.1 hypothetical protein H1Q64_14255 [Azospirillum brasilense]
MQPSSPMSCRIGSFDAAVHTDVVLAANDAEAADRLLLRGGGGTAFRPALNALTAPDLPNGLVALTDGLGCVPPAPPGFPVLWVLTPAGQPPAAWAQSVSLPAHRWGRRRSPPSPTPIRLRRQCS